MTSPAPSLTEPQTPQLNVERKLMQNYRVASAFHGKGEVAAVRNGSGQVELFTLGTDGTVWNFYPDPTSDTGYSGVSINADLKPKHIAAGVDSEGHVVVFMTTDFTLSTIVENPTPGSRWSNPPTPVHLPLPPDPLEISALLVQQIAGSLYVAVVITEKLQGTFPGYIAYYSLWDPELPSFQKVSSLSNSMPPSAWVGNSAQSAALAWITSSTVDAKSGWVKVFTPSTGHITSAQYLNTKYFPTGIAATTDSHGNRSIFSIGTVGYTGNKELYRLIGGENNQPYQWQQLSQGLDFQTIVAVSDSKDTPHVFAVTSGHILYHLTPNATSSTGYTDPAPIHQNVTLLGAAQGGAGAIDLFAVGTENTLTHLFLEETSGNWVAETIERPEGKIEPYISYATEVTLFNAIGLPFANADVSIWASEETLLTVNGATHFVDPQRRAPARTNSAGILSIAQETGSLATPTLLLNVSSMMAPDQSITILPNADVKQFLGSVQGPALKDAKDAKGQFLLGGEFHTDQNAAALANAVNQCMQWVEPPPARGAQRVLTRHGSKPGVWFLPASAAGDLQLLSAPETAQHWQLSFEGSNVIYQTLTQEEAEQLLAEKRASLQAEDEPPPKPWLEEIGDLVQGIIQNIITVTNYIVTTASDGIHATIIFIVNGVKYLFERTLALVEQVFDFVESIFAKVKVGFDKLCQWLGFLFNWEDILLTKDALVYLFNQFLLFLQSAVGETQAIVDNGIDTLKGKLTDLFGSDVVRDLAGQSLLDVYEKRHQQSSPTGDIVNLAVSNNIVLNGFIDNAGKAKLPTAAMAADTDLFQGLRDQLASVAADFQKSEAYQSVVNFVQSLSDNISQILNTLLKKLLDLLETVLQALLSGVKAIVDAMFQLLQTFIKCLQESLIAPWDIPFVTPLYRFIINDEEATLTTLDLIALIVAIPTTAFYKISKKTFLLSTGAEMGKFKETFNSQAMLRAAGFIKGEQASENDIHPMAMELSFTNIVLIAGGVSEILYGFVSAALDLGRVIITWKPPHGLHIAGLVLEGFAQLCSIPLLDKLNKSLSPGAKIAFIVSWVLEVVGCLGDLGYVWSEHSMPEDLNDFGALATTAYGGLHLASAIWFATFNEEPLHISALFMSAFSEISKGLLHSRLARRANGIPGFVCVGLDILLLGANGSLLIAAVATQG